MDYFGIYAERAFIFIAFIIFVAVFCRVLARMAAKEFFVKIEQLLSKGDNNVDEHRREKRKTAAKNS